MQELKQPSGQSTHLKLVLNLILQYLHMLILSYKRWQDGFTHTLKVRPIFLDLLEEQLCLHLSSECFCLKVPKYFAIPLPSSIYLWPFIISGYNFIPKSQVIKEQDWWQWWCAGISVIKRSTCTLMLKNYLVVLYMLCSLPFYLVIQQLLLCQAFHFLTKNKCMAKWTESTLLIYYCCTIIWHSSKLSSPHQVFQIKGWKTDGGQKLSAYRLIVCTW